MNKDIGWNDLETFCTSKKQGVPKISISKAGNILIKKSLIDAAINQIKNCDKVDLAYSINKNAIIFIFSEEKKDVVKIKDKMSHSVYGCEFMERFSLSEDRYSGTYKAKLIEIGSSEYWGIFLDERKDRKRKKSKLK